MIQYYTSTLPPTIQCNWYMGALCMIGLNALTVVLNLMMKHCCVVTTGGSPVYETHVCSTGYPHQLSPS